MIMHISNPQMITIKDVNVNEDDGFEGGWLAVDMNIAADKRIKERNDDQQTYMCISVYRVLQLAKNASGTEKEGYSFNSFTLPWFP